MIQLSCIGRAQPEDLSGILPALAEAAAAVDLDHSRLAAVLDWVQYRKNFRAPVMVRPSKSVMWSFNRSYWRHLAAWDETISQWGGSPPLRFLLTGFPIAA